MDNIRFEQVESCITRDCAFLKTEITTKAGVQFGLHIQTYATTQKKNKLDDSTSCNTKPLITAGRAVHSHAHTGQEEEEQGGGGGSTAERIQKRQK